MTKNYFTPIAIAMLALVTACSSGPKTTSLLEQARSDYRMAQINPGVVSYAALEMPLRWQTRLRPKTTMLKRSTSWHIFPGNKRH